MDVQHNSMRVREQRHRRIEDAEKRRQYRLAHGLEEPTANATSAEAADDQSPIAPVVAEGPAKGEGQVEYVDWEGRKKPVKKWLGIW